MANGNGENGEKEEDKKVEELEDQVEELEKQIDSLSKLVEEAAKDNPDLAKALEVQGAAVAKIEELANALEKTMADNQALQMQLEVEKTLTDREKAYVKAKGMSFEKGDLPPWLEKPKDEREEEMDEEEEKMKKNDESVTISGRTIRKSAVGEDAFAIMKHQADQIAKQERILADEIQKRETAELQKRADDEYPHVPGTVEERAKMLGAIAKMDEPLRKTFEAVLTASEKLAKAGFGKIGATGGKESPEGKIAKAAADFSSKVDEIAARDKCTKTQALSKARQAHPELFKAYQEVESAN